MREYLRGRGVVDPIGDFMEGLENYNNAARRYDEAAAVGDQVPEEIVQNLNSALGAFFLAALHTMNQNIQIFNNQQICGIMNHIQIYDMDTFNQALESFGIRISNQAITDTISQAFTSINQVQEEDDILNASRASESSFFSDNGLIILGERQEEPQDHDNLADSPEDDNLAASPADNNLAASAADGVNERLNESFRSLLDSLSSLHGTPDSNPVRRRNVDFSHRMTGNFQGRNTTV